MGVLAFGLCAFLPRAGSAVLLIPVSAHPAAINGAFRARYHLRLIGTARPYGSFLVHADAPLPGFELLRKGLLAIAAPALLCGATT